MRLITNSSYSKSIVYYPGVDFPYRWTSSNPAVYNRVVLAGGYAEEPGAVGVSEEPRYMLFMAEGGVEYAMSADGSRRLKVEALDYLGVSKSLLENIAYRGFANGAIGDGSWFVFTPRGRMLVMARFTPLTPSDVFTPSDSYRKIRVRIEPEPLEFDYGSSRMVRDWAGRIDGSRWSFNGKSPASNSLSGIGRSVSE